MAKQRKTKAISKKKKVEKLDEQVLFPEAKVGDITIKPWSFGILFEISEVLDELVTKIEDKNLVSIFEMGFDEESEEPTLNFKYTDMMRLFAVASKQILHMIVITLDMDEEEVKAFDMETGVKVAMTIFKQNIEILKNVFSLLFGVRMEAEEVKKE